MALTVTNRPQENFTFNPKVITNPVQPQLAPKVVSKPIQPALAPKVVTQPAQPAFNPQVQSQPAPEFLPPINVDNSPRFVPLGEAVKLKFPGAYDDMDSGQLGKTVAMQYPGIYDDLIIPGVQPEQPEKIGLGQSIVRGIANPFLRVGVTGYGVAKGSIDALQALGNKITGDEENYQRNIQEGMQALSPEARDFGYFGKVKPVTRPGLDAAGVGVELASNIVGGAGAVGVAKNFGLGAFKEAAKVGAKEGLRAGALAGFGTGLQQEDKTVGSVIKDTAIGAGGGLALGFAAGPLPAAVAGVARGTKNFISPSVEAALTKAIKPGKNNTVWSKALNTALPYLADTTKKLGIKVENLDDLSTVVKATKVRIWETIDDALGRNGKLEFDGNYIADEMLKSITKRTELQNPTLAEKIRFQADTYRRKVNVKEAEEFLEQANAELQGFYAQSGFKQRATSQNPQIGHVVNEAEAIRKSLDDIISTTDGTPFAYYKKLYGYLINLEKEVTGRVNVAVRQNPDSLAEQLSFAAGAGNIIESAANMQFGTALKGTAQILGGRYLKNKNTSDKLIKDAFKKLLKKPILKDVPFMKSTGFGKTVQPIRKKEPLALPAPKAGSPKQSINVPINQPSQIVPIDKPFKGFGALSR